MAGIAVAVAVVFGLLLAVRVSQGAPPEATWAELTNDSQGSAQALAGPGDQLLVAEAGDTFWSLALELAPGDDPRPVVDALVAANGGTNHIDVGQRIVVPASLATLD